MMRSDPVSVTGVTEPEQVRHFLASFVETILQPIDLPAVVQAWQHAARGEVRERSISLDELRANAFWLVNSVHGRRDARLDS